MAITLNGTTGISSPGGDTSTSLATTNLSYTGTLTGGTGVIAIGTNQIYKDASGNVGIGVTPSAWVTYKAFQFTGGALTGINTAIADYIQNGYYGSSGYAYTTTNPASIYRQSSGAHQWFRSTDASPIAGNVISFTQAMTLDASGRLIVGDTTTRQSSAGEFTSNSLAPALLARTNVASDESQYAFQVQKYTTTNTTSQIFVRFLINNGATASGYITANGANAATFTSSSDSRLKENITVLPNQLANICALKPSEFDYKDGSGHQIGFIAQEMQEVYPDVVGEGDDGMLTITGWSKTEARLVKAIQELTTRLEALEAK